MLIIFQQPHGGFTLECQTGDSVADVCRRHGLPVSQIVTYVQQEGGLQLFVSPFTPLDTKFAPDAHLVFRPNRNLDYASLLNPLVEVAGAEETATSWISYRDSHEGEEPFVVRRYLDQEESQGLVTQQVQLVIEKVLESDADASFVVGTSGGGDSNALLHAMCASGLDRSRIVPVMMEGVPDWDEGVERAERLCELHGLMLTRVPKEETSRIMGFPPGVDFVKAFERELPGEDLELLGVFGVRKVLHAYALQTGHRYVVIGSNLEDCLADALYYYARGEVPFPKPVGRLGEVSYVYPLWQIPKIVLDGCYPRMALENYEARYPSVSHGRALFYYLAQMLVDSYPGIGQDLLRGASALSDRHFQPFENDGEFGEPLMEPLSMAARVTIRKLFGEAVGE